MKSDLVVERVTAVFARIEDEEHDVGYIDDGAHRLPFDGVAFIRRTLEDTGCVDELDPFSPPDIAVTDDDPFCGKWVDGNLGFCRGDEPDKR